MKNTQIANFIVRSFFIVLILTFISFLLFGIKELIISVLVAFFLSIALNSIVYFFESIGLSRIVSVFFTLLLFLGSIYLIVYLLIPPLMNEFNKIYELIKYIMENLPAIIEKMNEFLKSYIHLEDYNIKIEPQFILDKIIKPLFSIDTISFLPNLITFLLVTPILLFIFMLEGDAIYQYIMSLIPNRFFEMTILITNNIKNNIVSYLKGISIQVLILGAILCTGLFLINLPYGIILGIFAAVVNIIPYVGPIIGLLPIIFVSFLVSPEMAFFSFLIFLFAQLVDNVYTQPVILSRSVNIHPIVAIFSVIAFQKLFGIIGMAIALPITGIIVMTIQIMYKTLKAYDII